MDNYRLPEELINNLKARFPDIEVDGNQVIVVQAKTVALLMETLKSDPDLHFDFLSNITAVDYSDLFEVIYNLISLDRGYTLMIKVKLTDKENPEVPSLCSLWSGADWQEKEVYDLMGVNFTGCPGHPTRILLQDEFEGHPLRKDFQWEGGRE